MSKYVIVKKFLIFNLFHICGLTVSFNKKILVVIEQEEKNRQKRIDSHKV